MKASESDAFMIRQVIGINTQGRHRYFLKFETFFPHKDYPDVDVSQRGSSGPMKSKSVPRLFCR